MRPPIIVGGMPRSGTTFVTSLLNAHHDLAITAEMNPNAAEKLLDLHEHLTRYMYRHQVRREVWDAKRAQFVLDAWCALTGDERLQGPDPHIGHKTPGSELLFERYEQAFEPVRPRLVYCMRDGWSVLRSLLNMPWRPVPLRRRLEQYTTSVATFERLQASRPDRVRLFQVDRMPEDPAARQAEVAGLFAFVGHEVDASVRRFVADWRPVNIQSSWQGSTDERLTTEQVRTIEDDPDFVDIQCRYGYA